jgi:hypothetical protein
MLGDGIRRDFATISDEERNLFINAIRALDTSAFVYGDNFGRDSADANGKVTFWDMMEEIHKDAHVNGVDVHVGPGFIPWHRALCSHMEGLLRKVDPRLSLHYWDWTTDPRVATGDRVALCTHSAMGDDGHEGVNQVPGDGGGDVGIPFQDFETTEGGGHQFIWRNVGAQAANGDGTPALAPDATILSASDFTAFATALRDAHDNTAHTYIGGSIIDPHFSFHDPFVFLLHSNLDRLWAVWQKAPNHPERLDPVTAYGTILNDLIDSSTGLPYPANYYLEEVQPWAGGSALTPTALNPWKSVPSAQEHVNYLDPSIITPPSYDTAP